MKPFPPNINLRHGPGLEQPEASRAKEPLSEKDPVPIMHDRHRVGRNRGKTSSLRKVYIILFLVSIHIFCPKIAITLTLS